MPPDSYHALPAERVLSELGTQKQGLASDEAARRLEKYGPNTLEEEEKIHPFRIFLEQFKSPLVWILIAAMLISAFVNEWTDFIVIGVIVVLNAILGFVQEYRAEEAIARLKKLVSSRAKVVRDGEQKEINASELVPGDILLLVTGDKISADARLIDAVNLQAQEAALTGESTPVQKNTEPVPEHTAIADRHCMVFSGTIITRGKGKAVVTGTGMQSEIGRIAKLIKEAKAEPTPLQTKLAHLSKVLGIGVLVIAAIVFGAGVLYGKPALEMFLAAIALAVAAIPEGLPAVVTISLALGAQRMIKRNALVRKLPSVETLGACTVICSDKTGTLTKNEMTVKRLFVNNSVVQVSGAGYSPEGSFSKNPKNFLLLLTIGALNNDAKLRKEKKEWKVIGDPTEASLLVSAKKAGLNLDKLSKAYPRVGEIEFTSERKRMTTIHKSKKGFVAFVKGAPEVIVGLCNKQLVNGKVVRLTGEDKKIILDQANKFAGSALRVLGFAYKQVKSKDESPKEVEKELVFVGLQGMIDPPRPEVREAIKKCKTAGIKVVMVTGDHLQTAQAIAKDLGIKGKAVTGTQLEHISDLSEHVGEIGVYARVNPAHKIKIIEAFKQKGEIVAMTGDGVNDAPALKKADLGIAMGITGTDVAKEASAMILADDNFASIVRAVEEGRRIFDNIQKYLAYLVSGNMGEVAVLFLAIILGMPLPLIAIQILWTNLVTDGLPALALGVDPASRDVMQRRPRKPEKSIWKGIEPYVLIYPVLLTAGVLFLFDYFSDASVVHARTVAFTSLVTFELFQALSCRSVRKPIFSEGVFANKWLWLAIGGSLALQCLVLYVPLLQNLFGVVPLGMFEWALIVGIASAGFVYLEIHKFFTSKKTRLFEARESA